MKTMFFWKSSVSVKSRKICAKNIPKVEYYELRNKDGELLENRSEINKCLKTVS